MPLHDPHPVLAVFNSKPALHVKAVDVHTELAGHKIHAVFDAVVLYVDAPQGLHPSLVALISYPTLQINEVELQNKTLAGQILHKWLPLSGL